MSMVAKTAGLIILPLGIEAGLLFLGGRPDLAGDATATIATLLQTSLVYLISVFVVLKVSSSRGLTFWILGAALMFRLTVWPLFPTLTDDLYRYRWEGRLQEAGGNPYQSRPVDPAWSRLRDETYNSLTGKDFKTIYGPLLELYCRWAYRLAAAVTPHAVGQVFWLKLPAAVFDLASIGVLLALLRARAQPLERVLIYAWSPLPVLEFWVNGHNDSLVVFLLLAACLAASAGRWTIAFAALGCAAAAKIWPLLLLPTFTGWRGWRPERSWQWVAAPAAALAWAAPYWSDVTENARHLTGYLGGWRNNDSIHGLLLWITGDVYRAKYLAFALLIAAVILVTLRKMPLEQSVLTIIAVMLLISANCHPWYLTWFLPFLAFYPFPPLLAWTALAPLSYEVVAGWKSLGVWNGSTPLRWWIYGPVFALMLLRWGRKRHQA
jgi:hypothetical protein